VDATPSPVAGRLGRFPVAVVSSPAEDGRRRRPPSADLEPVGKVVTAQQHSMAEADSSKVFVRVPDCLAIPPGSKVRPTGPSG
jgi:hypothetical protein